MKRVLLATAACCVLVACQREATAPRDAEEAAPSATASVQWHVEAASDAAQSSSAAPSGSTQAPTASEPPPASVAPPEAPELAFSYRYALEAPEARVAGLMRRHERACVLAGPRICQLLGAETAVEEDSGKTGGELRLRAVPVWIEDFRDGLETDAADVDGRVLSAATATDDVTRLLGDRQTHVVRLASERERLERQLQAYRGPIDGRLELERELEAVAAELASGARDLQAEEARVVMATLEVTYRAQEAAVARGDFAPVARAARGFTGTVMAALGALLTIASVLLVPGAVGAVWGAVVLLRRRRRPATPAAG